MFHRIGSIIAAAPLLWMSWTLARLWVDPASNDDAASWVRFGVGLMLLEFVLLHSGVFVGAGVIAAKTLFKRILVFAGLLVFYGVFALALSLGISSRAVLEIYGFVMLGRFVSVLADAGSGTEMFIARSVGGTVIYLPMVFASVLLPWPRLGITEELAAAARTDNSSGVWVDEPHRAIGAAAIYFLLMGLIELSVAFKKPGGKD
ncbi:MAG TPA: hypothetical protein VMT85_15900 [Thermoanaerobaculia bacterium]|nr:hypothetical protein [Thermoanaerobaculia bacterium]